MVALTPTSYADASHHFYQSSVYYQPVQLGDFANAASHATTHLESSPVGGVGAVSKPC